MNASPPDGPQNTPPVEADPGGRLTKAARQEGRLKAALKANMARRKAQVRARASENDGSDNDNNSDE